MEKREEFAANMFVYGQIIEICGLFLLGEFPG
jgi:hypothetical protein